MSWQNFTFHIYVEIQSYAFDIFVVPLFLWYERNLISWEL